FPVESVRYCLKAAGVSIENVNHVGISRDPSAHLHKKVIYAATRAAKNLAGGSGAGERGKNGRGILGTISDRLANAAKVRDLKDDLARQLGVPKGRFGAQFDTVEHHRAHLASSFYVSQFECDSLLPTDG